MLAKDDDAPTSFAVVERYAATVVKRLAQAEATWLESKKNAKSSETSGWMTGLLDTILGNIQLVISNVHVRLEGSVSNIGIVVHQLRRASAD